MKTLIKIFYQVSGADGSRCLRCATAATRSMEKGKYYSFGVTLPDPLSSRETPELFAERQDGAQKRMKHSKVKRHKGEMM